MLQTKRSSEQLLLFFLVLWTVINIVQAAFVELHADEAYYWMYSRFMDWGYFDHPPMVAVFIKLGDALFRNSLGLRLITVVSSALSVYLLWKIVSRYTQNFQLFALLFSGVVLFHVYGFITTPDSPLFFFSILFFYVYQRYAEEDKAKWALLLALIIACLLYSKYHGILVLFFTIISNFKLLRRPSFWMIVVVSICAFLPHIMWQINNHYPSFYYHVIDRNADFYKFKFTSEYVLAQLALAGPLVGWFLYKSAVQLKSSDAFIRAVKFNFYGVFVFFLFSTFKGRVEAHWTLPAMLCLFILAYIEIGRKPVPKWLNYLSLANIALIILVRLILIFPIDALMKVKVIAYYFGTKKWAAQIKDKAGNYPVIFTDSFQIPSRYNYYTYSTRGFGYDSRYYRKNQYDIWPLEDSIRNRKAYYVLSQSHGENVKQDTIATDKGLFYGLWINKVRMYQKVTVRLSEVPEEWQRGETKKVTLEITNPYQEPVSLGNAGEEWKCILEYGFKMDGNFVYFKTFTADVSQLVIKPHTTVRVPGMLEVPKETGKYKLIFSVRTEPFSGGRNSGMITADVK
ncbi:ArnT family glycosyltransferase [Pedobacter frigoris]|uniref:Glycosyltransferase family 39 protein n=1 Tax=Pedobacter frigoris TaxID=2571272 RepID=A0A4U1CGL8_9SPHI|nr:glycosyltransferase family 39 protein [Pedobacter frigoris]TKC06308.1 glycosyltransferase family 39 protein [Pedobacter frigoris]